MPVGTADRRSPAAPPGTGPADLRPAWWGLVPLVAGAAALPLVLVDPVFAAVLGAVVAVVGVLGRGRAPAPNAGSTWPA